MGEYADEYLDRILFGGGRRRRFRPTGRTCERCGRSDLIWHEDPDGWRLYEDGQMRRHECNPPSEDDFDVIAPAENPRC